MTAVDVAGLAEGVRAGGRAAVARAITLVESRHPVHRPPAQELVTALLPHSGNAVRLGVSGAPGAGKSTFIDALGMRLVDAGHRVAVLAVDPTSALTRGSVLGDRTRMARLAGREAAFVRPSPSGGTLGGVAAATREAMVVVEAAGYDVVIVETVGVGQSEFVVADMVDTFLLLTLGRTGDQLQGIKRGVLELADVVAVNKADGEYVAEAQRAARELSTALRLLRPEPGAWQPPVVACSAVTGTALDEVWRKAGAHRRHLLDRRLFETKRRRQLISWTAELVREELLETLSRREVKELTARLTAEVGALRITPRHAAARIVTAAWAQAGAPPP
ncbi:methylmalonyl Co-A mutase-associated GTPase MeaB [Streptomyces sp. NPDC059255]|uniref:methylmalonyl Co-A mutase-associated GTPase MeaB n=1 Tax=Streptomyces sp. NPDC059255 TaxID=3346793 RepID=UPI003698238E